MYRIAAFILGHSFLFSLSLSAQSIEILFTNGTIETYPLAVIRSISFPTNEMRINHVDGTLTSLPLNTVNRFVYVPDLVTDVATERAGLHSLQVYPNPTSDGTTIAYTTGMTGDVSLLVTDIQGRPVWEVIHQNQPAGQHQALWEGKDGTGKASASGIYLCTITFGNERLTQKIIIGQ